MSMALNVIGIASLVLVIINSIKMGSVWGGGDPPPVAAAASLLGALVIFGSYAYLKDIF